MSKDTPVKAKLVSSSAYQVGLKQARKAVVDDLDHVLEVDASALFNAVLPPVSSDLISECRTALKSSGAITSRGSWRNMTRLKKEKGMLEPIQDIFVAIQKHVSSTPVLAFSVEGDVTPFSERENTSRPDGFLQRVVSTRPDDTHPQTPWDDIVLPMEIKVKLNDDSEYDVSGLAVPLPCKYQVHP